MPGIRQTITSDTAQSQREIQKLNAEIVKLKESMRDAAREGKKGADDHASALEGARGQLTQFAAGFVSVNAVVGLVRASIQQMTTDLQASVQAANEFGRNFAKALGGTGDLPASPRVSAYAQQAVIRGATRGQALESFEAVSGGAPGATIDTRLAIASQVVRAAPLGDIKGLGATAGRFSESGIFQGRDAESIAELALIARQQAGSQAGQLESPQFLQAIRALAETGGVSPEQAVAMATTGLRSGIGGEGFLKLADVASQTKGGVQAVLARPERYLEKEQAAKLRLLDMGAVEQRRDELIAGVEGDYIGSQLAALGQTAEGRAALTEQALASRSDNAQANAARKAMPINTLRQQLENETLGMPSAWARRAMFEYSILRNQLLGDLPHEAAVNAYNELSPLDKPDGLAILQSIERNTRRAPSPPMNAHGEGAR